MAKISRAEVRRRFEGVGTYRAVSRKFDGEEGSVPINTEPRKISRVTSTGVYIEGVSYAVTPLNDRATWYDDGADILRSEHDGTPRMTITYKLGEAP